MCVCVYLYIIYTHIHTNVILPMLYFYVSLDITGYPTYHIRHIVAFSCLLSVNQDKLSIIDFYLGEASITSGSLITANINFRTLLPKASLALSIDSCSTDWLNYYSKCQYEYPYIKTDAAVYQSRINAFICQFLETSFKAIMIP